MAPDKAAVTLRAVLQAISTLTETPQPAEFPDSGRAVRWVIHSIEEMCGRCLREAVSQSLAPGMRPQSVESSIDLINHLDTCLTQTTAESDQQEVMNLIKILNVRLGR